MPELIDMIRASVWKHPQPELREKEDAEPEKEKPKEKRSQKAAKDEKQEEGGE